MKAKQLILKTLRIKNFKGIKEMLIPVQLITTISGDNATGKTTINDAAMWLLFGKDSQNRSDFEVQPLNENNEIIHYLDTEVEGTFEVYGNTVTLKRVLQESWQKPRGQAESVLKGTTTSYYIDEVPQKQKEYKAFIDGMISEDLFKLLTNPFAFETSPWKQKRALLFEMCGDVSDEDVANSNEHLKVLPELLAGKTIDDFRKIVAQQKKKLKEDLVKLPARIDELKTSLVEIDTASLNNELNKEIVNLQSVEEQLEASNKAFEETRSKQQQLISKESYLAELKRKAIEASMKETNDKKLKLNGLEFELKTTNSNIERYETTIKEIENNVSDNEKDIQKYTENVEELRKKWAEQDAKEFEFNPSQGICPHCGQELPADKLKECEITARKAFEDNKKGNLDAIIFGANTQKEKIDKLEESNKALKERIEKGKKEVTSGLLKAETLEKDIEVLKAEIKSSEEAASKVEMVETAEMKLIKSEIEALKIEIESAVAVDNTELKTKKAEIQKHIDSIRGEIAKADVYEKSKARIAELEKEHEEMGQRLSELEQQEFLTEEFTRTKVSMLEDKINSRFKYVTFKLFSNQVNGGITECCESLINGIPFSNANNAARINAGLDIINALVNYYGYSAPIFIDNAESVNELIETSSQTIRLVVSHDKELVIS